MAVHSHCYACSSRSAIRGDFPNPPTFKQLSLGTSENGQLIVLPRASKEPSQNSSTTNKPKSGHLQDPFILNLPDELLSEIAHMAITCDSSWGYHRQEKDTLALLKVCKLFHRIAQPFVFEEIQLRSSHSLVPACRPFRRLHRTLLANPHFGTFCKTVHFHIPSISATNQTAGDFAIAEDLVGWLPNVTTFSLHGGFGLSHTWLFLKHAFQNMPRIDTLTLSRECFDLEMAPALDIIQSMRLKKAYLHGICARQDRRTVAPIPKALERTSPITTLDIGDFSETPAALAKLLKLPKALHHFNFGKIYSNASGWTLSVFQNILDDHRASLKSISIGPMGQTMSTISFLDYPKLETLNLSRWVFNCPPEAAANILAPNLHTFIWDFGIRDQHSEALNDFGPAQLKWLIAFTELATQRKSALRKIEIIFNPEFWCGFYNMKAMEDYEDPWDLMEEARQAMKPGGIELIYHRLWTKEDCIREIRIAEETAKNEELGREVEGLSI